MVFPVHAEKGVHDSALYSNPLAGESESGKKSLFKILGTAPSAFKHMGSPKADAEIFNIFVGDLLAAVIVVD